jgi:hypothetical protein
MIRPASLLLSVALPWLSINAVRAEFAEGFKSPTGNITCAFFEAFERMPASIRCDIANISSTPPRRPRNCDGEYGHSFEVRSRGPAERLCITDTVTGPEYRVLPYGRSWRKGGITCDSAETGITCMNETGGGFEISRAKQRVF